MWKLKSVFYILIKNTQETHHERVNAFCKSECVPAAAHSRPQMRGMPGSFACMAIIWIYQMWNLKANRCEAISLFWLALCVS